MKILTVQVIIRLTIFISAFSWVPLSAQDMAGDPPPSAMPTADSLSAMYRSVYLHTGVFYPHEILGMSDGMLVGVQVNQSLSSYFQLGLSYRVSTVQDSNALAATWSLLGAQLAFDPFSSQMKVRPFFSVGGGLAWYRQSGTRSRGSYLDAGLGVYLRVGEQMGIRVGIKGLGFQAEDSGKQVSFLTDFGLVWYW